MTVNPKQNENKHHKSNFLGAGLVIGVGVGLAIGAAMDNSGTGLALGIGAGLAIGAALQNRENSKQEADNSKQNTA